MIAVSDGWKAAHKKLLLPETHIEITYAVTEPGLQADALSAGNMEDDFSEAENLLSTAPAIREKYSCLEHNFWGLDGTFEYYDGSPKNPGYITTEFSNDSAVFTALPTITITLSKTHVIAIPGITITWSEVFSEWATKFRISAYNDDVQVAQTTVENNTQVVSRVWFELNNYNKLVIEVLEWCLPQRRAKIASIFLGILNIYTKNDLMRYVHSQSVDLFSAALPKNEIVFNLRNDDDRWNPDNPTGVERYMLERQEVIVHYGLEVGDSVEWIDAGHFWLSEWNTPANGLEASFTARDAIEFMGDNYIGIKSGTLYDIAIAAFEQAELPVVDDGSLRYEVDQILKNYSTEIQNEHTIAEILQLVAHMGCCVLYQTRDGKVHLVQRGTDETDYEITQDISYAHPEIVISKPLKAVAVDHVVDNEDVRMTLTVGASGEVQTIANELIQTGNDAYRVAYATAELLKGRKTISGDFRANPCLDALDIIKVHSKYAENTVVLTDIEYSMTGGAIRGSYTGRIM